MKVILLTDIAKVGQKYEVKEVASGYAQNFLFPKKLAERADAAKLKNLAVLQKKAEAERQVQMELLAKNMEALAKVSVTVSGKANEQGGLFEAIHIDAIVNALKEQGHVDITEDMIKLEEPIKSTGTHTISVQAGETQGTFTLVVEPEKSDT